MTTDNRNAIWYSRLFSDAAFAAKVRSRYAELLPSLKSIPKFIDDTEALLDASSVLNFQLWNPAQDASQNGGSIINGDENLTFHQAVALLKDIYEERLDIIRRSLP